MQRHTYATLVAELARQVREIFPWDLADALAGGERPLLLDIRCPHEFEAAHIAGSINVPRGVLEMAVDYGYEDTMPALVESRTRRVVLICRSGNRSVLAAHTLAQMGYRDPVSLKTGLRGWNDDAYPLVDGSGRLLDPDAVEAMFDTGPSVEQLGPAKVA